VPAPDDAVRVTGILLHCGFVVTRTPKYLVPGGTVTLAGTEATRGLLLEKFTGQPPAGALAPREMISAAFAPPGTEDGLTRIDVSAGSNIMEDCAVAPNKVAVTVAVTFAVVGVEHISDVSLISIAADLPCQAVGFGRDSFAYQALCQGVGGSVEPPDRVDRQGAVLRAIGSEGNKWLVHVAHALRVVVIGLDSRRDQMSATNWSIE